MVRLPTNVTSISSVSCCASSEGNDKKPTRLKPKTGLKEGMKFIRCWILG